jgi:hypothetical protein
MLPYGKWNRSARVTSCRRVRSINIEQTPDARLRAGTYITSKVLLLAQECFVPIKLAFKLSGELLDLRLIRRLSKKRLVNLLFGNAIRDRIKLRILDSSRLLELSMCLGLSRNQLWTRPKRRDVPPYGARLEQLEPIFLL